ncbi:unnamed protein product [Auanema sp. JU1783]|nr:unnamed protein product [Auanema sp. JU1783]
MVFQVLRWYERRKVPCAGTHRYFFNPVFLDQHFEKYAHLKLEKVEKENGVKYIESLGSYLCQYEENLSPLVKYLFDGGEKPRAKDILDACKLDPEFSHFALSDLCLILSQVGEAKAFLDDHELESDLMNTLFYNTEELSLQDAIYEYLIHINLNPSAYAKKEQTVISKAICELMGLPSSRTNGVLTLIQIGLTIDAYILSAVLCSSTTHSVIKGFIENNLPTYFPSMKFLNLANTLEYEKVCEMFDYPTLSVTDPVLVYRYIRNALAQLERENVDLKRKISGRMLLSNLLQSTLLFSLLKKNSAEVISMLDDFWFHVPDNVLSDMFANMERVFFCQAFKILADIVDILDYHSKNAVRISRNEYSGSLSALILSWLQQGWTVQDSNNNNNDNNMVSSYTSIYSKFLSIIQDSKLKFCIMLAQSLVRYEAFSFKDELSAAFKTDETERNYVYNMLKKSLSTDVQDPKLRSVLSKIESLLFV